MIISELYLKVLEQFAYDGPLTSKVYPESTSRCTGSVEQADHVDNSETDQKPVPKTFFVGLTIAIYFT